MRRAAPSVPPGWTPTPAGQNGCERDARTVCDQPDCKRPHVARGLCSLHYGRMQQAKPSTNERRRERRQQRASGEPPPPPRKLPGNAAAIACLVTDVKARNDPCPGVGFIWFTTVAEALEADRVLLDRPCRDRCVGRHVVAVRDGERIRVRKSEWEPSWSLERELIACYGLHDSGRVLPPPLPWNNPPFNAEEVPGEWPAANAAQAEPTPKRNKPPSAGAQYNAMALARPVDDLDDADRWLLEHDEEMAQ